MPHSFDTKPGALTALLIIHKAMLAGQVIFAVIAFYLVYTGSFGTASEDLDKTLQVIAIIVSAAGLYYGNFLFKRKLIAARETQASAKEKFAMYQSACIVQWVMMEIPGLFVIICFLLTHNYAFLALAAVLILLFAMSAPSKLKIVFHLQLDEKEIVEL